MRVLLAFAGAALLTFAAIAEPTITSVTPREVPALGGTLVTITGTGFNNCPICSPPSPPRVFVGGLYVPSDLIDEHTIRFTSPPYLPSTAAVSVEQWDGSATLPNALTFVGTPGLVPVLFPVYSPPVPGAFESEFVTEVTASNRSELPVDIFGVDNTCLLASPVLDPTTSPVTLPAGVGQSASLFVNCATWPARTLWVAPDTAPRVSFNIRVHDTARNALSHGTEIPVVRESDFTTEPFVFTGLPHSSGFRKMMRLYALAPEPVLVRISINGVMRDVTLEAGRTIFEPAYAAVALSNTGEDEVTTVAVFPPQEGPWPPMAPTPLWGFVTVTNNATQEITTITPDM